MGQWYKEMRAIMDAVHRRFIWIRRISGAENVGQLFPFEGVSLCAV